MVPTWMEPVHRQELTGGVKPWPAEPAKQLLRAVRGEGQSRGQEQKETGAQEANQRSEAQTDKSKHG